MSIPDWNGPQILVGCVQDLLTHGGRTVLLHQNG